MTNSRLLIGGNAAFQHAINSRPFVFTTPGRRSRCDARRRSELAPPTGWDSSRSRACYVIAEVKTPSPACSKKRRKSLVGTRGFEPPTPTPPVRCDTRLRYVPTGPIGQARPLARPGGGGMAHRSKLAERRVRLFGASRS